MSDIEKKKGKKIKLKDKVTKETSPNKKYRNKVILIIKVK
jgi:hypothetical protein